MNQKRTNKMNDDHSDLVDLRIGDAATILKTIAPDSVQTCITSPPYFGLRDYGVVGQIGLEESVAEYVAKLVEVFQEVKRVLKSDGSLWLNIGDTYSSGIRDRSVGKVTSEHGLRTHAVGTARAPLLESEGIKPKDLIGIPWAVAFALRDDGWYLRSDIIWSKTNIMPESVTDRPTKSHEYIFLFTKSPQYYYDQEAIREPTKTTNELRNKRSVWTINSTSYDGAHFATFPEDIPRLGILAGSKHGDTVLDPFAGSGTTGKVAIELGRKALLCELNPEYGKLIKKRTTTTRGMKL